MAFSEFDWIASLRSWPVPGLVAGIGDDAAVFEGAGPWAVSTDTLVESVHFLPGDDPGGVGWKTAAVNLSDMAACGCRPRYFLLNLQLTPAWEGRLEAFREGLLKALDAFGVSLVGGDTVWSPTGPFSVTGTILGTPYGHRVLQRAGARPGDGIYITGEGLGGSFPQRHLRFTPRLVFSEALCRAGPPTAMIDVSDGLLQDLGHILDRSGVAAELDLFDVPISSDVKASGETALEHALADGEDFELLLTWPAESLGKLPKNIPLARIGRITQGAGLILARRAPGAAFTAEQRRGYSHGSPR